MPFTHAVPGKQKRPCHGAPSRYAPWDHGAGSAATERCVQGEVKWHDQLHTARKWQKKESIVDVCEATTIVQCHYTKTPPILVSHIHSLLHRTTCQIPACMPKSLWLVIAGSSPCQVNVSNQSSSPGHENQPIRAVSRCWTTQRQPERPSAFFPPGAWALANMLREAPLVHGCWEHGVSSEQMIWEK